MVIKYIRFALLFNWKENYFSVSVTITTVHVTTELGGERYPATRMEHRVCIKCQRWICHKSLDLEHKISLYIKYTKTTIFSIIHTL